MPVTLPRETSGSDAIPAAVRRAELIWRNPHRKNAALALPASAFSEADMHGAEARRRCIDPFLAQLFDGTVDGRINSPLLSVGSDLARTMLGDAPGSVWVRPTTTCR